MKLVFTPEWFTGTDVMIEIFSFVILFLFFFLSYKSYKITKNKKSLYLGIGFLLIAIAEIATILTKMILFYDMTLTREIGNMIITYHFLKSVDVLYNIGFFCHRLLTLLGLYIIYRMPIKNKSSGDALLVTIFIIISAVVSITSYYVFHLVALMFCLLIVSNYYDIYKKNKSRNTMMFIISVSLLALSQIIFLLILSNIEVLYAVAQFIQLVAYLMLLVLIVSILNSNKKQRKK